MRDATFHLKLATALLIVAAVAGALPAVDLAISDLFYRDGAWFLKRGLFWRCLVQYGCIPPLVMVVGASLLWGASHLLRRWRSWRRPCLVMALTVLLGPGLLVNVLIKQNWGRPRPLHVQTFGGHQPYRAWWQPSEHLTTDRGFASGHAATAFSLLAAALVIPSKWRGWRRTAIVAAAIFGALVSLSRVVQGGHFFSDVAISAALTYWIVAILLVFPFETVSRWVRAQYARGRSSQVAVQMQPLEADVS